jgi:hypothetical protein
MRANKRREVERQLLLRLRGQRLQVECGDCGVSVLADWKRCVVRNVKSWVAMSEVQCACGSTLHSYIGDAVPMGMLREHFVEEAIGERLTVVDSGPVMSFVRRAVASKSVT